MPFSKLGLSEHLQKALLAQNYAKPYPIQEAAIPVILTGKDVLGIAKTGSGKTASFALPMLERFMDSKTTSNRHVRGLVLVPTRELALQVEEVFKKLSGSLPKRIKTLAVFGGASINPQMINLQGTDILVATPGRLLDLIASKAVYLSEVDMLVLDEADKMMNLGFKEEMQQLFRLLPAKRQNILFSATLSPDISAIKDIILHNPEVVEIKAEEESIDQIQQIAYHVTPERKGPFLRYLIKQNNMQQVLVFVSSGMRADAVEEKLFKNGIRAAAFHGQKSQGARNEALKQFKAGKIRVLVATDLASRGIDIPFLPFVINYELPRSPKDYVHRIGRTGRANESGEAISLVTDEELHHFKIIQKKMGKRVTLVHTDEVNLHGF